MNNPHSAVPLPVLDQAIQWQLRSHAYQNTDDCPELSAWLKAHPDHMKVWEQLGELDAQLKLAAGASVRATLAGSTRSRHLQGSVAMVLASVGLLASLFLVHQKQPLNHVLADYRTAVGERQRIVLPDQTVVHLNTRSAVDLAFDDTTRGLIVREGEVEIETAHTNPAEQRPFIVTTRDGSMRALGTRFIVRTLAEGGTQLTVTDSAVLARPAACAQQDTEPCSLAQRIEQGHAVTVQQGGVSAIRDAQTDIDAWKDGMLVVENMRLEDIVAELARHRVGRVKVESDVADLRVTGTFPLADSDYAISTLVAALPVRLETFTRYAVTIRAR